MKVACRAPHARRRPALRVQRVAFCSTACGRTAPAQLRWHTAMPMLATGVSLGLAVLAGNHVWLTMALFCLAGFTSQAYLPAFWTLPTTILGKSAAATAVGLSAWATWVASPAPGSSAI